MTASITVYGSLYTENSTLTSITSKSKSKCKSGDDVASCQNIGSRGGSSPKILGAGALPHQPLHNRVHFLHSLKPEKYEVHIGLHIGREQSEVLSGGRGAVSPSP